MKICLIAPELVPNRGGVGVYVSDLIRGMPDGVELTVLTLQRWEGSVTYSASQMEGIFGHRARILVLSEGRDSFLYNAGFQVAVLRWMRRNVASERFDLIHSEHAHMPDVLSRLVHQSPPTVRTVHTTIAGQRNGIRIALRYGGRPERSERWQVALQPLLDLAEWSILSRKDFTITPSEWLRQQLIAQGYAPDGVVVVYNPVDTDRFRPTQGPRRSLASRAGAPVVLFSGRPTVVKGARILARAIPLILRDVPEAEFVFTGASKEEFLPLIQGSPEAIARISFLGFVPFDDLPGVVGAADVCVVPSLYENVPIRITESMACGIPVVATNICGIPEAITSGRDGVLVPPGSPEALARGVVELLTDAAYRQRLGREARRTMESRFARRSFGPQMLRVYEQAILRGK